MCEYLGIHIDRRLTWKFRIETELAQIKLNSKLIA